jgi:arylsulfatase A-like enzyme
MINHLDAKIGRVIEKLKETAQYENTIIIFAGDNGLALGQHGLLGKQSLYEHSVHVPLIMSGPGIPKAQKRDAFCYLLDVFPTLCQLCDIEIPESVEGHSLAAVIKNPKRRIRKNLLFAYRDFQRAVRDKRYKLIEYSVNSNRTTQLFDLKADPCELNNLADDPKNLKNLTRLRKKLAQWKQLGDKSEFRQIY